jgi:cell division transport system ATP-binding protein
MPEITLKNVTKRFRNQANKHWATGVENVDLTVKQGEFVFVIGSSGAGKSTLLQLMTGQIRPTRGKVCLDGRDLQWLLLLSGNRVSRTFGKVWQEPTLARKRNVEENMLLAARAGGLRRESPAELRQRILKVLGLVGMDSGTLEKYPAQMSVGECRRIELARALLHSPPILVLDEITANWDDDSTWDMFQLLHELNRKGTTVIMATHASQYVNIMRRRVVTLVDGRVFGDVQKGKYGDVM